MLGHVGKSPLAPQSLWNDLSSGWLAVSLVCGQTGQWGTVPILSLHNQLCTREVRGGSGVGARCGGGGQPASGSPCQARAGEGPPTIPAAAPEILGALPADTRGDTGKGHGPARRPRNNLGTPTSLSEPHEYTGFFFPWV